MPLSKQQETTHNSGMVAIYAVTNTAQPGRKPVDALTPKYNLRYHERTVGLQRYYAAMQANIRIQYVLRCPKLRDVTTQDVAIPNDGKQYTIVQIQYPEEAPTEMDLTLQEVTARYDIT